jgi:1-acyl-sn-glycerol-3-phosphate acyltransferase
VITDHYHFPVPLPENRTFRSLARLTLRVLTHVAVTGADNVPLTGGVLLAMNHIGDPDSVMVVAHAPRPLAIIGKSEILDWPVMGPLARAYGMIPVRRGEPDRVTLQKGIDVLRAGNALLIAPEGRESPSGTLERAKEGPAFMALHAHVPIVPIAITGTMWPQILPEWKRLRRPRLTLTFGPAFTLPPGLKRRAAADLMMHNIATLLPPECRGVYADGILVKVG